MPQTEKFCAALKGAAFHGQTGAMDYSPFNFPRGLGDNSEKAHATGAWAPPPVIARYSHQLDDPHRARDAVLFGAFPSAAAFSWLRARESDLTALGERVAGDAKERDRIHGMMRMAMSARADLVAVRDDRHIVTIAGTRAGKGRSAILPNLAHYGGSVVVIDPKGENATLTAHRRGAGGGDVQGLGQKICVLDPFKQATVADAQRASFNPLDTLDGGIDDIDQAALIADALIVPGGDRDAHWDESARAWVHALILHVRQTRANGSLLDVQDLVGGDRDGWREAVARLGDDAPESALSFLLDAMQRSLAYDGLIAAQGALMAAMGDNERGSVISTAARNLKFLIEKIKKSRFRASRSPPAG